MASALTSGILPTQLSNLNCTSSQLFSLCLFFAAFLFALKRRYITPIRDIPGPFFASFSDLWKLWHIPTGHIEEATIALHKKHGVFVRVAHNEVSVSDPDAVGQVLLPKLRKGNFYAAFAVPDHHYQNQMSERDPKEHVRKERNVAAGYALSNIIKSEPFVDATIELLVKNLDQLSRTGAKVHLDRWFTYCAFDIVGEVAFSRSFGFLKEGRDVGRAVANSRNLFLYISLVGHAYWLHSLLMANPIISWLNLQPTSHILDTCLAAVDSRKKNDKVRRDMMERWLEVRRTYPDRMEEKEVLAAAMVTIGAGSESISTTLQAIFYYLLRNPMHLLRLRNDLDDAQSRGELSRIVSYAETQKLPFLQACMKEAYRFHSAISFNLPRVAGEEGITVAGRTFPKGTVVSLNPWVIHRDKGIFGDDAEVFNPERWLDPERARVMEKHLIHWGAGYNMCPGRHLAHLEISKIAATVLRDFDVALVDPTQEWTWRSWFLPLPGNWPCYLTRRDLDKNAQ